MATFLIICLATALLGTVAASSNEALMLPVIKTLTRSNCLVFCDFGSKSLRAMLTGDETRWPIINLESVTPRHLTLSDIFICAIEVESLHYFLENYSDFSKHHQWFVYGSNVSEMETAMDEQIYFIDEDSLVMTERYSINGFRIENTLGNLEHDTKDEMFFKSWTKDTFLPRRSNLLGIDLKGLTDSQPPFVHFHEIINSSLTEKYISLAPTFQYGMFQDVLNLLQKELNFTTSLYLRGDRDWGGIDNDGNWTGMVRSLIEGEADIAVTSMTLSLERSSVVDFLPAISEETLAMVIARGSKEALDWSAYVAPLAKELWIVILVVPLFTLAFLKLLQSFYSIVDQDDNSNTRWKEVVADYCTIFCTNLGASPIGIRHGSRGTIKMLIFAVSLVGNVVFMSYNASLTSSLAVREIKMPFTTLEELLHSQFRPVVTEKGILPEMFLTATSGIYRDLFTQKMGKESFYPDEETALEAVSKSKNLAYFGPVDAISINPKYQCLFEKPWTSNSPNHISMALPKSSQYYPFLHYQILRLKEMGALSMYERSWKREWLNCVDQEPDGLGFEKLVSLFVCISTSFVMASAIFVIELIINIKSM